MKKRVAVVTIIFICIIILWRHNQITLFFSENKEEATESKLPLVRENDSEEIKIQDCFSADLPGGWNVKYNNNDFEAIFTYNKEECGYLSFYTPPNTSTEGLVTSIEGMHAYPKDIGYELSAAQNEKGEEIANDEVHYYYYDKDNDSDMVGDLYFKSKKIR